MTARRAQASRDVTSRAQASRLVGVSPWTVSTWIAAGRLPRPPWTARQVEKAAVAGRQAGGRGSTAEHGTPSRWRAGCNCALCAEAHNADVQRRREAARVELLGDRVDALVDAVAAGARYGDAVADLELTPQAVTAHRRRDPQFAERLDEALLAGRDPDLPHGSAAGWRRGCRCPECRGHHEATARSV